MLSGFMSARWLSPPDTSLTLPYNAGIYCLLLLHNKCNSNKQDTRTLVSLRIKYRPLPSGLQCFIVIVVLCSGNPHDTFCDSWSINQYNHAWKNSSDEMPKTSVIKKDWFVSLKYSVCVYIYTSVYIYIYTHWILYIYMKSSFQNALRVIPKK